MHNIYLEFQDLTSGLQRIQITKEATRLGREPGLDVVIASTAANVSRRHAEIRLQDSVYLLVDLGSFNGTFLNGRRIASAEVLHNDDVIQLGPGGPSLRFRAPQNPDSQRTAHLGQSGALPSGRLAQPKNQTIFASNDSASFQATLRGAEANPNEPRVFLQRALDVPQLTIGRGDECEIRLDGLLISNNHARISQSSSGLVIEDLTSTNGTYVNGQRIASRTHAAP